MDIETAARAAFEALHSLHNRRRVWATHPDGDLDVEWGRDTFRHMMAAVAATLEPAPEPVVEEAPTPVAEPVDTADSGEVKVGGGALVF